MLQEEGPTAVEKLISGSSLNHTSLPYPVPVDLVDSLTGKKANNFNLSESSAPNYLGNRPISNSFLRQPVFVSEFSDVS